MSASPQSQRRIDGKAAAAAALVILICLFSHLGAVGLMGPDEPRYAWIARSMAVTGDWVTPHLYLQPWFEKPILYYWAAAVGFVLHVPAEWAARLPSALAALAAALAIGWLVWKHYGAGASPTRSPVLLAPLLFSTSVAAIGFARAATPDMLFCASITLAMASAATVFRLRGALRTAPGAPPSATPRDVLPLLLFGAFLGLAVLAKGPAAIILAGGAIGLWALAARRWRAAFRLAHPFAVAAFAIVALPWYILCALRNPNFVHVFIFQNNFDRYLTPVFQHRQPFWFFGPVVLLALLPWTVLLWSVAQQGLRLWREKSWHDSPGFFLACWAVFPVLFFSFSQSKLPGYILPAVPPLALILAVAFARAMDGQHSSSQRWALSAIGVTWIALGLSAAQWTHRLPQGARDALGHAIFFSATLAVAGGAAVAALAFFRKSASFWLSIVLVAFFVEIAAWRILPSLDPYVSARWHGELLRNDQHSDRIFTLRLQRSWDYGLAFYLGRELPEWSPADPAPALVLTTQQGMEEMRRLGRLRGPLDEDYKGIVYVPAYPLPH